MDNKLDQRDITSSLRFFRVADACFAIVCVVSISISCWLVVEVRTHHTSIAILEMSNAKLTDSNIILMEEVEALKDRQTQHEKRLEKQDKHEESRNTEKRSLLTDGENQTQVMSISQLLDVLQRLRGSAGLPGLPGRDGEDGEDGEDGRDGREAVNVDAIDRHINTTVQVMVDQEMAKFRLAVNEIPQVAGAVYTRWGRTVCPPTSNLVMKGIAAGTHFTIQGGAAEYICLPEEPDLTTSLPRYYTHISGVEYQRSVFTKGPMHDQNAPCAICQTAGRSIQKMFPAKSRCPDSTWRVEYTGFLMTEYGNWRRTQYVCVDASPEAIPGQAHDTNGALWYHVVANCAAGQGALGACPPYNSNSVLGCIVCSK